MKWFPLILMIIIAVAYYPFMFKIVLSQLKLQNYSTTDAVARVDDDDVVRESIYGSSNRSESLQEFLLKQSNVVAGRAIFISGLAQQGIMRFMPTPEVYKESDHLANAFLVFVSFAMAFSYFAGNIALLFQMFIPDTIKSKQLAFAIMIKPIANFFFFCYIMGFLALFLGNIFVADGCNYESLRRVSICFGLVGLVMLVMCIHQSAATDAVAVNSAEIADKAKKDAVTGHSSSSDGAQSASASIDQERHLANILAALNTAGSMSTFAVGYLFYNIITYESDVLRLEDNDDVGT